MNDEARKKISEAKTKWWANKKAALAQIKKDLPSEQDQLKQKEVNINENLKD
jgi:hypothetical protein